VAEADQHGLCLCCAGEQDGVHYHFTTREAMEKDVAEGLFLETAQVHNNMYGTSKKAVQDTLAAGKVAILDVGESWSVSWVSQLRALLVCTPVQQRSSQVARRRSAGSRCCPAQHRSW
jgi:hypothetical protein